MSHAVSPSTALHPVTGEPRRPLAVWASAALFHSGAGLATAGMLWAFWNSLDRFTFGQAAWLNGVVETEPGSLVRVAMVTGLFVITLLADAAALIAGHHAWAGYRWTRWAGLLAVLVALLTLMVNPLASWSLAPLTVGAALLWLPSVRRWFDAWHARRHPAPRAVTPARNVVYGPLERYR